MKIIDRIKDGVTDFIGLIVTVATLTKLWSHEIVWMWDGLIGIGVGLGLFMLPDQWIGDAIKKVFNKYFGDKTNES